MIVTLLCPRCQRELGPARLKSSSLAKNALRAPAKGMTPAVDPKAEKIRAKKERKASLRATFRTEGVLAAAKQFLSFVPDPPPDEECKDCKTLMASRRAA